MPGDAPQPDTQRPQHRVAVVPTILNAVQVQHEGIRGPVAQLHHRSLQQLCIVACVLALVCKAHLSFLRALQLHVAQVACMHMKAM